MKDVKQGGFTIIELMLFITISTLMTITLLVGWTVAINTQSYRDATRSLAATLQSEYNQTINVVGERGANFTCTKSGSTVTVAPTSPSSGQSRGTSDCILMGRYVTIDGTSFTSDVVLGIPPTNPIVGGTSDAEVIAAYSPTHIDSSLIAGTDTEIPWVAATYKSSGDTASIRTAFLIIRSPETGTTYTYHLDYPDTRPICVPQILASGSQAAKTICLDPGTPIAQPRAALSLARTQRPLQQ